VYLADWPAETVAENAVEGLLIENAGGALEKMFKIWGELGASSETVRVSLRGPEKSGEKVTLTVQLAFAATVALLQEAVEFVKSAGLFPAAEILETCMGDVPVLVMATLMGVLARPCVVAGKVTEVGRNLSAGPLAGEFIPVPVSATD
jgi:3-hydroxyisobutyrate dehydrogenase-like beta-hydroxyacid dehydrogenase